MSIAKSRRRGFPAPALFYDEEDSTQVCNACFETVIPIRSTWLGENRGEAPRELVDRRNRLSHHRGQWRHSIDIDTRQVFGATKRKGFHHPLSCRDCL